MSALKRGYQLKSPLDKWAKSIDVLDSQKLPASLIFSSKSSDIVGKRFNHYFGALLVVSIQGLIQLFNVHRYRLLEKLHVLRLPYGNKH